MGMLLPISTDTKVCQVKQCERQERLRRGMCGKHYRAWQLYGDPLLTWQDVKPERTCSIEGCEKKPTARGWCSLHWQRWRKHGDPEWQPQVKIWGDTCRHPECSSPTRTNGGGRGYCSMHYGRLLRTGELGDGVRQVMSTSWAGHLCSIDECSQPVSSLGYCNMHYLRFKRTGDPHKVRRVASLAGVACRLDECDAPAFSTGLCKIHYDRKQRHGDPRTVIAVNWAGISCSVDGCIEQVKCKGYCKIHYRRLKTFGNPNHPGRKFMPAKGHTCTVPGCDRPRKANGLCGYHHQQQYKLSNPMLVKLASQRRRARKLGAFVTNYTHLDLAQRMAYFGSKCWMCSGPFEEVDHVKPLSKGGKDCLSNLRPSCRACNRSKSAKWFGVRDLRRFIKQT